MIELLAIPLGLVIGTIGSLTGIGGGFLLMPVLLLLYPDRSAAGLAVITMTVVFFNALAGIVPAALHRRINWRTVLLYAVVTLPTVVLGLAVQTMVTAGPFRRVFGAFIIVAAGLLFWLQSRGRPIPIDGTLGRRDRFWPVLGISPLIGFVSSFFGIGGGFLFVPLFVYFLGQPTRNASANSQVILVFVSLCSIIVGIVFGNFKLDTQLMSFLVIGVVVGAQIGHALSLRLKSGVVMLILAILMLAAGIRLALFA